MESRRTSPRAPSGVTFALGQGIFYVLSGLWPLWSIGPCLEARVSDGWIEVRSAR